MSKNTGLKGIVEGIKSFCIGMQNDLHSNATSLR